MVENVLGVLRFSATVAVVDSAVTVGVGQTSGTVPAGALTGEGASETSDIETNCRGAARLSWASVLRIDADVARRVLVWLQ